MRDAANGGGGPGPGERRELGRGGRGWLILGLWAAVATLARAADVELAANAEPALADFHVNAKAVPRYEKFELSFQARGHWTNPFDPAQVAIDCRVEPPSGAAFSVPAFFSQDYGREEIDGREKLTARSTPGWKVRIAPTVVGKYRYRVALKNGDRTIEGGLGEFECTARGTQPGFVRVSPTNPRYFQRDDGSPFFVIGQNMHFPGGAATYEMDRWLTSLARNGGNFVRTWWCHAFMNLESRVSAQPRRAFGIYDLESAWRADHGLELCEQLGIAMMPTLETQQFLRVGNWWQDFTYIKANGGPVTSPADYFTNPAARQAFKNRLRYIVARWSYSTAIFSWQFWNEVDVCNDYDPANVAAWHREMSRYLRSIDPNHHTINTNFGNLDGRVEVDDLPETEVVSTNLYTRHDSAESALEAARFMTARRAKPYLLSEFGLGHHSRWAENDPTGVALHDGLWGAALGGAAGGALVWEWDAWVDTQNLYHHYAPFAATMKDIPWHRTAWRPIEVEAFDFREARRAPYYTNVFFEGFSGNYQFNTIPEPRPEVFTITPEGEVDRPAAFNGVLSPRNAAAVPIDGQTRNDAAVPTRDSERTIVFTLPRDGQLILHVPRLEGGQQPILQVTIDGKVAFEKSIARDRPDATWDYFLQLPFALPAGPHRVTVANLQPATTANFWRDRVTVAYELTNYRLRRGPNLDWAGLQSDDCLLVWLHHPQATWLFLREGREPAPQPEGVLQLRDVSDGAYTVLWRDTWTGEVLAHDTAAAKNGRMALRTPPIARSAVAKLMKISAEPRNPARPAVIGAAN